MSSTSLSSPIFKLNDDVLLYIFMLNADMFDDVDALDTARFTSQVCRSWRTLMLASSSLWARLIDMDRISDSSGDEWRKELMERSGDALLWIQLSDFHYSVNTSEFFDFIAKNWHRIQKLFVHGNPPDVEFIPLPLKSPAPHLEVFDVSIFPNNSGETLGKSQPGFLFGNHAPRLFDFHLGGHSVDHRTPWLSHLQYLELDGEYFLQDLLGLLLEARNLEELTISPLIKGSISPLSPPAVSLLHLYSFSYYGCLQPCLLLLDHLKFPPDCALSIEISITHGDQHEFQEEEDAFRSIVATFTRHLQCFLKYNPFRRVGLEYLKNRSFDFQVLNNLRHGCLVNLIIPLPSGRDDSLWLKTILDQLALLDFSSTTLLQFKAKNASKPFFLDLFSRFISLRTIRIDTVSLTFLMRLQDEMQSQKEADAPRLPSVLFPNLEVIKVPDIDLMESSRPTSAEVRVLVDYILSRARNGHPIHLLDMRDSLHFIQAPNLDALKAVQNLRVLYTRLQQGRMKYDYIWSTYDAEHRDLSSVLV